MSETNLIPAGRWDGIPTGADLGETETGKEYAAVSFDMPDLGKSITWYGYFTDKTARTTIKSLRTCGWQGDNVADLSSIGGDPDLRVQLVIEHEADDKGIVRAKVRWVNQQGGLQIQKPLDQGKRTLLANRMRGLAMETAKSAAVSQASRGNGAAPVTGHLDADIPF